MKFIQGKNRSQVEFFSLEDQILQDNDVRLIDMFVSSLDLSSFGFRSVYIDNGRPAYRPSDLLRLFIYGYMNRIRSSRQLEKECRRNIELMWLMHGLVPDHNTISNFRKDNPQAIKKVFRSTVELAKSFDLIGGKLIAGDSTKLRAQNSKKNNFSEKKIEKNLDYIETQLVAYSNVLASSDGDKTEKADLQKKIEKHLKQKKKYLEMKTELATSGDTQISSSDPDSRQMITRNNITEVAYNVQATVDAKHNLPIDFKVTNQNDSKAMGDMVRRAKTILGTTDFIGLYDKGYHTGSEFEYANRHGIEVIVGVPGVASHAPDLAFDVEHFVYNKTKDQYICPAKETLTTNGQEYNKSHGKTVVKVKHYKTNACLTCEFFSRCTKNKKGRLIERSKHMNFIDANKKRLEKQLKLYRKRQAIVEHPFGTIKRQWDFYYIMTKKSIKHATADVGMIFTAYNLRRILNIIDKNTLKEYLKVLDLIYLEISSYFKPLQSLLLFKSTKLNA